MVKNYDYENEQSEQDELKLAKNEIEENPKTDELDRAQKIKLCFEAQASFIKENKILLWISVSLFVVTLAILVWHFFFRSDQWSDVIIAPKVSDSRVDDDSYQSEPLQNYAGDLSWYHVKKWVNEPYTPEEPWVYQLTYHGDGYEEKTPDDTATYVKTAILNDGGYIVAAKTQYKSVAHYTHLFAVFADRIILLNGMDDVYSYAVADFIYVMPESTAPISGYVPATIQQHKSATFSRFLNDSGYNVGPFHQLETTSPLASYSDVGEWRTYSDDYLYGRVFGITMPDQSFYQYALQGSVMLGSGISADALLHNGDTQNHYHSVVSGCGRNADSVLFAEPDSVQFLGNFPDGTPFYKPNDYAFAQYLYEKEYLATKTNLQESDQNYTFEEFYTDDYAIVYQDALGSWNLRMSTKYFGVGGCAKPVVYLYPEQTANIDVYVGANITISDPLYTDGWQDVIAEPNGKLTYQGKNYDSLFWEGQGYGNYPDLSNVGVVVAQANIIPTIKQHLVQQGFNFKEIADFVEFWQDNLPKSQYVKLSWLTTAQTDQLAPLAVFPQPETVIRTFMELTPLDQPIALIPQSFVAPARSGFTVTEWGGLKYDL